MDQPRTRHVRLRVSRMGAFRGLAALMAGVVCVALGLGVFKPVWSTVITPSAPPDAVFFKIGTGSIAGTYFRIGDVIAGIISHPAGSVRCGEAPACGPAGLIAVAQASQGSVQNVRAVASGQMHSALAQADIVKWAHDGEGLFAPTGPERDLRVIANLYPEAVHLVARWDAEITKITDLAGKRVSIDRKGSGSYAHAQLILDAIGLTGDAVDLVYLDPDMAAAEIEEGTLDAFFYTAGAPVPVVAELIADGHAVLAPVAGPDIDALREQHTYMVSAHIPEGAYLRQPEVETIGVGALWIVNQEADEELIFQVTQALWNGANRPILVESHPIGALIDPQSATLGVPIAFHPGAERFYRQSGMTLPTDHSALDATEETAPPL